MDTPPSWAELVDLLRSPKPPLSCTVARTDEGDVERRVRVVFDGRDGWWIDDGERFGLQTASEHVLLGERDHLALHTGNAVHWRGLEKTVIDGARMANLGSATGMVVGSDAIEGRPCWIAEVEGLRTGEDVTFRLWIDLATGISIRMERLDLDRPVVVEVRDLLVAEEPG